MIRKPLTGAALAAHDARMNEIVARFVAAMEAEEAKEANR